jgi:hypothetical protein
MPALPQLLAGDWSATELTAAINALPWQPRIIGDLKVFEETGIATTKARIEFRDGVVTLIPHTPRGAPPLPHTTATRSLLEVQTAHFPTRSTIYADSLQDQREFGGGGLSDPNRVRNERLGEMRLNLDQNLEHQQIGALKGTVVDVNGVVLVDLFAEMGVSQQTQALDLATTTTKVATRVVAALRKCETALGHGLRPKGYAVLAAPDVMDGLRDHPSTAAAVQGWEAAAILNSDHRAGEMSIGGVRFIEYRNPESGTIYVAPGEAYLLPLGVPKLCLSHFAPADWWETVNGEGVPYYAKAQPGPMDRYVAIEAQSNPISICTRPRAIVKLLA